MDFAQRLGIFFRNSSITIELPSTFKKSFVAGLMLATLQTGIPAIASERIKAARETAIARLKTDIENIGLSRKISVNALGDLKSTTALQKIGDVTRALKANHFHDAAVVDGVNQRILYGESFSIANREDPVSPAFRCFVEIAPTGGVAGPENLLRGFAGEGSGHFFGDKLPQIEPEISLRFIANHELSHCLSAVDGGTEHVHAAIKTNNRDTVLGAVLHEETIADVFAVLKEIQLGTRLDVIENMRDARLMGGIVAADVVHETAAALDYIIARYDDLRGDGTFLFAHSPVLFEMAKDAARQVVVSPLEIADRLRDSWLMQTSKGEGHFDGAYKMMGVRDEKRAEASLAAIERLGAKAASVKREPVSGFNSASSEIDAWITNNVIGHDKPSY